MSSRTRAPDLVVSVAARLFLSVAVWPVLAVSVFPGPGQALLAFLVCGLPLAGAAVLLLAGRTRVPAIVFGAVNLAGWPVLLAWVERDVIATLTATVWWIAVLYTLAQDGCRTDEPRRPVPPRRGPRDAPVPVWVATGLGLVVAVAAGAYAASGLVTGGPNQAPAHAQLYSAMSLVALSALFAAAASVALLWAWRPARVLTLSG